jgi:enoyl-CoA hydratase
MCRSHASGRDDPLLQSSVQDGIGRLIIDRPERRNALDGALLVALREEVAVLSARPDVKVLVVTGAGGEAFVAGADVAELEPLDPKSSEELSLSIAALHAGMRSAPFPVIAAVRGWCLGGGLELALASDFVIAADDARFGLPEIRLGIIPGGGGLTRLVRVAGPAAARWMAFTGEVIDAARARELGLVASVVPAGDFDAVVADIAGRVARASGDALRAMKAAFAAVEDSALEAAVAAEARIGAACYGTADQRRLMRRFLERKSG